MTPKITRLRRDDTHRLIPAAFTDETVLKRLADNVDQLEELIELEGGTNDRLLGEANLLPGISVHELLFGVDHAQVVNAAFTHAHPAGGRFNGSERGAWYAAFEAQTAQAEIIFHKSQELREIDWRQRETFNFDDYVSDFRAEFHDLRGSRAYSEFLDPNSYARSQRLARDLLTSGSPGIVYPSARRSKGTCLVCFRPALVTNVRKGPTVAITFDDPGLPPVIRKKHRS